MGPTAEEYYHTAVVSSVGMSGGVDFVFDDAVPPDGLPDPTLFGEAPTDCLTTD